MKFIPSRELRNCPGKVWKDLKREGELVVTSNGQPVALMLPVSGDDLEEGIRIIRSARLRKTIRAIQRESVEKGTDKMTMAEIDEEVRQARRERRG